MTVSFHKIATLSIYAIAVIAFFSIISGFITGEQGQRRGKNEIEQIVFTMYDAIDQGQYEDLFNVSFEGRWGTHQERDRKKSYYFDGLLSKDDFIKKALKDFGKNGWRIRFTSLAIPNIRHLTRTEFANQYPQEHEVLQYVDPNHDINTVYLATVKGYKVGRCAIIDWEKDLPLVWTHQKWKALIRGNPADFDLLHREHWLTKIDFQYTPTL